MLMWRRSPSGLAANAKENPNPTPGWKKITDGCRELFASNSRTYSNGETSVRRLASLFHLHAQAKGHSVDEIEVRNNSGYVVNRGIRKPRIAEPRNILLRDGLGF